MSAPSMTLYSNPASPFARKVRVLLAETGQLARVELKLTQPTPVNPDPALVGENPLGKLPALVLADGEVLYDSRVICEYLDSQHGGLPLLPTSGASRWRRLTLASLADGVLDAALLIRYETALRPEPKHWDQWLGNQALKIERGLAYLEQSALAELGGHFDIAGIGVACALGYLDFRQPQLAWRERYPQLAAWFAEVSQRPSMQGTQPLA
ncbi:glutathione S-transferase [Pseudomonas sp. HR96]|uniref:glutathione S-transferase n=1 Tax=Pseudomonas sp. HR96 TaxID=1027966 RepID=UPI002A748D9B|nr:glutathione S-transferase [Pseudomonas sp. HR96]WPP00314.1 glutathione S-transferase [Pseudomonas sp. HR96]